MVGNIGENHLEVRLKMKIWRKTPGITYVSGEFCDSCVAEFRKL